ncbi:unnamed protein product [Ambrosiozyma monospora]|uniref:Unnamed protein product n=1 Tax=Ambrosiozyma monospora TaxID=43982 RepID=A0A9W6T8L0_AMBMO|nr:unnamed protein product [Ambrosiozyma monospora]
MLKPPGKKDDANTFIIYGKDATGVLKTRKNNVFKTQSSDEYMVWYNVISEVSGLMMSNADTVEDEDDAGSQVPQRQVSNASRSSVPPATPARTPSRTASATDKPHQESPSTVHTSSPSLSFVDHNENANVWG